MDLSSKTGAAANVPAAARLVVSRYVHPRDAAFTLPVEHSLRCYLTLRESDRRDGTRMKLTFGGSKPSFPG